LVGRPCRIGNHGAMTDTPGKREGLNARRFWRLVARPFWRATVRFLDHDGPMLGGSIAFSVLLALFPFILFLVALAGLLGQDSAVRDFMAYAFDYLPVEVGRELYPVVSNIVLNPPQGGILTVSMIGTLWVASSGVEALRTALDRAYGVEDRRPFWWRRLQGLGFVVGGASGILIVMLLVVVGPLIWTAVNAFVPIPEEVHLLYDTVRYLTGGVGLALVIWCLYRLLPNVKQKWINAVPGTLFATAIWLFAATIYSMYLQNIADYTVTYGSLGGVIGALIFFFFTAMIFIYGAELNAALMEQAEDGGKIEPAMSDDDIARAEEQRAARARAADPRPRRVGARVFVLDADNRLLLFLYHDEDVVDPGRPDLTDYWITPGGGHEPGETLEQTARRELREETGLAPDDLGARVAWREVVLLIEDIETIIEEHFFVVRLDTAQPEIDISGQHDGERAILREVRWWKLNALLSTDEVILPPSLPDLVANLIRGEDLDFPIRLDD